jgi:hypothetical protein
MGYRKHAKKIQRANPRHNGMLLNDFITCRQGVTPHPLICMDEAT